MDDVLRKLIVSPPGWPFSFASDLQGDSLSPVLEHLRCFFPGSVALGVMSGAVQGPKAQLYLEFAANMTLACYQLYNSSASGGWVGCAVHPACTSAMVWPCIVPMMFGCGACSPRSGGGGTMQWRVCDRLIILCLWHPSSTAGMHRFALRMPCIRVTGCVVCVVCRVGR